MHTQMTGSCAYATYYLVLSNLLFHSVNNCTFDSDSDLQHKVFPCNKLMFWTFVCDIFWCVFILKYRSIRNHWIISTCI